MTLVTARLNNLRIGPRKVRLVAGLLAGRPLAEAIAELQFLASHSAAPLLQLLRAAAADAEHNFKLKREDLVVKRITVDGAQTYKRYTPRAFGRAAPIRKRGSHVTVTLESRTGATVAAPTPAAAASSDVALASGEERTAASGTPRREHAATTPRAHSGRRQGFASRFFNRKTG
jgi:large subunit ribosomal protein L22